MWYIKQNGRSLTPGGPHYHRIWTWTFLEYSVTTCKQRTKQKRKENERKWNKTMCKSKDMTCGADEKWEQVRIFSVHYCFVCLSECFTKFLYHLDRFVFSNLICIYTIQQANYNHSKKIHIEKKDYWNIRNHVIIKCFTSFISTL